VPVAGKSGDADGEGALACMLMILARIGEAAQRAFAVR